MVLIYNWGFLIGRFNKANLTNDLTINDPVILWLGLLTLYSFPSEINLSSSRYDIILETIIF